jgi:ferredoxin
MEGNGPGGGDPVRLGALIAGVNPVAVDVVAGRLAGIPAELLYVEREAARMGLAGTEMGEIEIAGVSPDAFGGKRFTLPSGLDVQFGLPTFIKNGLRRHLTSFPVPDDRRCVLCGICRDACPPEAIHITNSSLVVNHGSCIRCWCCRELCPHDAMQVRQGVLLRIATSISRSRRRRR